MCLKNNKISTYVNVCISPSYSYAFEDRNSITFKLACDIKIKLILTF